MPVSSITSVFGYLNFVLVWYSFNGINLLLLKRKNSLFQTLPEPLVEMTNSLTSKEYAVPKAQSIKISHVKKK